MENWHEIIREIVFKLNIEHKDLAKLLYCSPAYVSRIFTGRDQPSKRIAKALNEMYEECN